MITFLAFLMTASATPASAQTFDSDPLMAMTEVRCEETETRARMGRLVQTVLHESLAKLDQVNPRVSSQLRLRLQSARLLVTCEGRAKLERKGAEADSTRRLFGSYRIRLGLTAAEIVESTSLKNTILHELLHFARIDNFSTRVHNDVWDRGLITEDNVYACADVVYPELFVYNAANALAAEDTCEHALGE